MGDLYYGDFMARLLQKAFEELATLPEDTQDQLGERLLRWRQLRGSIEHARDQVAAGKVAPLNAQDIIKKARALYAAS